MKHASLALFSRRTTDDQQLFSSDTDHVALNKRLRSELSVAVNWFRDNDLMANPKKSQAMVLGAGKHDFCFVAKKTVIDEYDNINLLGINLDNHVKFNKHISNICKRVNKQLQVLKRFRNLVHVMLKLVFIRPLCCLFFFIVLAFGFFVSC